MALKHFRYEFAAGPFETRKELLADWRTGNCRRAVQYFLYRTRKIFLPSMRILLPAAYYDTGEFVFAEGVLTDFAKLQQADVIYAEKIRDKEKRFIDRSRSVFTDTATYVLNLHTALWNGEPTKEIWHATAIDGGSRYWPLEKFLHFYKPVAVKRIQAI